MSPIYMDHVENGLRAMSAQPDLVLLGGTSIALFHSTTTLVDSGHMNSSVAWWVHEDMNAEGRAVEVVNYLTYNFIRNLVQNLGIDVAGRLVIDNLNLVARETAMKESPS